MPKVNPSEPIPCPKCDRKIARYRMKVHLARHQNRWFCRICPKHTTSTEAEMENHYLRQHSNEQPPPIAPTSQQEVPELEPGPSSFNLPSPEPDNQPLVDLSVYDYHQGLKELMRVKQKFTVPFVNKTKLKTTFNFPIEEESLENIEQALHSVYDSISSAAKINIGLGYILHDSETDTFKYFHPQENQPLFSTSLLLANRQDINTILEKVSDMDLSDYMRSERPSTKWRFHKVVNLMIFAFHVKDVPLGCPSITIPHFIKSHRSIKTLTLSDTKQPLRDHLCMFRALLCHKNGGKHTSSNERDVARLYKLFLQRFGDKDPKFFRGVKDEEIPVLEDLTNTNILVYTAAKTGANINGQLVRKSRMKYKSTCSLLRVNKHVCYITNRKTFFKSYRCQMCDQHFKKSANLTRHMKKCKNAVKHKYSGKAYQLAETVFEELERFEVFVEPKLRLTDKTAVFDFESISQHNEDLINTENTTYIGNHVPISVSIASNLNDTTTFLVDKDPSKLIRKFCTALDDLSKKYRDHMLEKFQNVFDELHKQLDMYSAEILSRKSVRTENVVSCDESNEESDMEVDSDADTLSIHEDTNGNNVFGETDALYSDTEDDQNSLVGAFQDSSDVEMEDFSAEDLAQTERLLQPPDSARAELAKYSLQYLLTYRNALQLMIQKFEKYCGTLPVFGFNSSRYDLNLIKEYLIPYLVIEKGDSLEVIKKVNNFTSFSYPGIQFLDIMNFLGGFSSLDNFLKAYQTTQMKGFFPYEWFDSAEKLNNTSLPSYDEFYSKLKGHNPLGKDFSDYEKLLNQGVTEQEVLRKLKLREKPKTGEENYGMLKQQWEENKMTTFADFLRLYNNGDVEPTLEALMKMIRFYHEKYSLDILKVACTLPSVANRILHQSTNCKFFPFAANDKDLEEAMRNNMDGGPSIVFNRLAVVGETNVRKSQYVCQRIVGIDANQLYPWAMMQLMPSGPYIRWLKNGTTGKFYPVSHSQSRFEQKVMLYHRFERTQCHIESIYTTGYQKKIGPYSVDGFCAHCKTVVEAQGCYWHGCSCQINDRTPSNKIKFFEKKREKDAERRQYLESKGYTVIEVKECEWRELSRDKESAVYSFLRRYFPFQKPLSKDELIESIVQGGLFGVIECDLFVPDGLKEKYQHFPPIFKNIEVSKEDIGEHMQQYAEQNGYLKKPRRMLISSFSKKKGLFITPLLKFYLSIGLKIGDVYQFVQYSPEKCFAPFVHDVVHARRQGDLNKESTVLAETMKLIGNSSYGRQIMNREKFTETRYVTEENIDKLINDRTFKSLSEMGDVFEVVNNKKVVEHKEAIVIGLFILQYAKLRMLHLWYNFFLKFCDLDKFEELEMDTDSLYLALATNEIEDLIKPEMRKEWMEARAQDCKEDFEADSISNFFPRQCCEQHRKHDNRTPGLFKEEFSCTTMVCLCSKTYMCFDELTKSTKTSSKGLNKSLLLAGEPLPLYKNVLHDQEAPKAVNRGFKVHDHSVVTYEIKKKGLNYFYPKRKVHEDRIHTSPLDI